MPKTISYGYFSKVVVKINQIGTKFNGRLPVIDETTLIVIANETRSNPMNMAGKLDRLLRAAATKLEMLNENAPELKSDCAKSEFELMKKRLESLTEGKLPK